MSKELADRLEWIDEARQIAAQCWCDPETEQKIMDPVLAEAIAKRIALWMETGAQHAKNEEYWRERATKAEESIAALRSEPVVWMDGFPSKPWSNEWFIAETTYGDRVVLTALPEEYAYDFKTADDTYIKADKIKRWMQFPDSEYLAPSLESRTDRAEPVAGQLSAAHIRAIRKQWDGDMYPCNAEFYALCDMALRSLTAPTNTPNGDRQELIDKCLDAGRDEGIEAAASILHEPWSSAVRALAQDQRSEAVSNAERVDINQGTSVRPTDKQSSDHPTEVDELLRNGAAGLRGYATLLSFSREVGREEVGRKYDLQADAIDAYLARKEQ